MAIDYLVLDVFTADAFAGNPLAVVPDAAAMDEALMQPVARELNLSETVFVMPGAAPDRFRLRIFTPVRELPFAGHPTVGAALALAGMGRVGERVVFEEGVGDVPVVLEGGRATLLSPTVPQAVETAGAALVAGALGLRRDEVAEVSGWSAGVPFTCVRLPTAAHLARVALDPAAWQAGVAGSAAPSLYVYSHLDEHGTRLRARMFAPAMGIAEDPATGAAATALAGRLGPGRYEIEQGVEMGRPSIIHLEVGDDVRVGGEAVKVAEGRLLL